MCQNSCNGLEYFSNADLPDNFITWRYILSALQKTGNTRIYNLSRGPHITRFSVGVARKRKTFEYTFVLK